MVQPGANQKTERRYVECGSAGRLPLQSARQSGGLGGGECSEDGGDAAEMEEWAPESSGRACTASSASGMGVALGSVANDGLFFFDDRRP